MSNRTCRQVINKTAIKSDNTKDNRKDPFKWSIEK